jgi:hypothetical protein
MGVVCLDADVMPRNAPRGATRCCNGTEPTYNAPSSTPAWASKPQEQNKLVQSGPNKQDYTLYDHYFKKMCDVQVASHEKMFAM